MHAARHVLTPSGVTGLSVAVTAVAVTIAGTLVAAMGGLLGPVARDAAPPAALPPVGAEQLLASIPRTEPAPLAGTVRVSSQLGLAGVGPLGWAGGTRTARLWADGRGHRRIALPAPDSERTIVDDGTTVWFWDSAARSVARAASPAPDPVLANLVELPGMSRLPAGRFAGGELLADPVTMAGAVLAMLRPDSVPRVDPAVTVADRPAYQLVLDPVPTERTLLREVRVAVDARTRVPLEVSVMANGSARPALRVGFTDLRFGPQDPALFGFAPPPGVPTSPVRGGAPTGPDATVVGRGWDTVLITRSPAGAAADPALTRMSRPISGPWGHGRLLSTTLGNAVFTADGRVAAGAVPAQVLTEALAGR